MKIAFIFAGQGAQKQGMGEDFYTTYDTFKEHLDKAQTVVKNDLINIMFHHQKQLDETIHAQPAIFAFETGIVALLRAHNIVSDGSCGLSLGEYAAYYNSGVFDLNLGLTIIKERAKHMQAAANQTNSKMCALIGDQEAAIALENEIDNFYLANFNTPKQTVAGGSIDAIDYAASIAKNYGIKRVIPLNTSGAFHTPYMQSARDAFATFLQSLEVKTPQKALYLNTTGRKAKSDLKAHMARQITEPVKFDSMIFNMIEDQFDTFITIGPDDSMASLIKKIDKTQTVHAIFDVASFETTVDTLKELT
ncbi:MAG: ACP S-malonyltransferase [Bacillota bacterium]